MREFDPCNSDWQFPREPPEQKDMLDNETWGIPFFSCLDDDIEEKMPF